MKPKRVILWTIVGLILANSIFLASAANMILQSYFFSAGRFSFQYDDTKVVVDRLGDFKYDSSGKLEALTVYVTNKDQRNGYSGWIELSIDSQQEKVDISLGAHETKGYDVELDPHLELGAPLIMNVNVIMTGVGGADLIAQRGAAIADSSIDGTIGTEWNDAQSYTNIPITPAGTANIWVKNDGTNLYLAIRFTADSNNPWVALQLATGCMDANSDGVLLGHTSYAPDGYVDIKYDGQGPIIVDAIQNGRGAIAVGAGNVVTVEVKKPLASGDTAGSDIAWAVGSTYSLVIAWDTNGGGSSGGTTNHRSANPIARTILISA